MAEFFFLIFHQSNCFPFFWDWYFYDIAIHWLVFVAFYAATRDFNKSSKYVCSTLRREELWGVLSWNLCSTQRVWERDKLTYNFAWNISSIYWALQAFLNVYQYSILLDRTSQFLSWGGILIFHNVWIASGLYSSSLFKLFLTQILRYLRKLRTIYKTIWFTKPSGFWICKSPGIQVWAADLEIIFSHNLIANYFLTQSHRKSSNKSVAVCFKTGVSKPALWVCNVEWQGVLVLERFPGSCSYSTIQRKINAYLKVVGQLEGYTKAVTCPRPAHPGGDSWPVLPPDPAQSAPKQWKSDGHVKIKNLPSCSAQYSPWWEHSNIYIYIYIYI